MKFKEILSETPSKRHNFKAALVDSTAPCQRTGRTSSREMLLMFKKNHINHIDLLNLRLKHWKRRG